MNPRGTLRGQVSRRPPRLGFQAQIKAGQSSAKHNKATKNIAKQSQAGTSKAKQSTESLRFDLFQVLSLLNTVLIVRVRLQFRFVRFQFVLVGSRSELCWFSFQLVLLRPLRQTAQSVRLRFVLFVYAMS